MQEMVTQVTIDQTKNEVVVESHKLSSKLGYTIRKAESTNIVTLGRLKYCHHEIYYLGGR